MDSLRGLRRSSPVSTPVDADMVRRRNRRAVRRHIVGVIGGDEEVAEADALEIGAAIAGAGLILCTGGYPGFGQAVKNVSMRGAVAAAADARTIGFLPTGDRCMDYNRDHHLYVETRLTSTRRNAFTGLTPDAMIVFSGSRGTLTEMAFAEARGTPVWFWHSLNFLRRKRREHQTRSDDRGTVYDQMRDALEILSPEYASQYDVERLSHSLDALLERAIDTAKSPDTLISDLIEKLTGVWTIEPTGYPGRRDEASSKDRFEADVLRISGAGGS
jgi:predicted Rossmann-fold nucleotide-binding protein